MRKQQISMIARLGLSVLLLALLLTLIDRQALVEAFSNLQLAPYLVALALYVSSITLWAMRWRLLIIASEEQVSLWRVWITIMVGSFFSLFLPTIIGNDLARMYWLLPDGRPNSRIVSSVMVDRAIGLVSLMLMGLGAGLVGYQFIGSNNILLLMVFVLVAFAVGWVLFFNRDLIRRFKWILRLPVIGRLESKLRTLYQALYHLFKRPALLMSTLGVSLLMQATEIVAVIFIAIALNITVEPAYFFIFMPIIWVITMIPVSASGLGLREGAFAFFFVQVGASASEAVALSLLYYVLRLITGGIGGVFFLKASLRVPLSENPKRSSEGTA